MPRIGTLRVALRKESVDRNFQVCIVARGLFQVALRKESVDRNGKHAQGFLHGGVALRKESVDRNRKYLFLEAVSMVSLSARRAWIEIPRRSCDVL